MPSALDAIGGEEALQRLVTRFYDLVEHDPVNHQLHRLHFRGHGLMHIRAEQMNFLSGYLGGRRYYQERHGHMDLRQIHAHVPIRDADADLWLGAMDKAIADCGLNTTMPQTARQALHRAARMLVNDVPDWRNDGGTV